LSKSNDQLVRCGTAVFISVEICREDRFDDLGAAGSEIYAVLNKIIEMMSNLGRGEMPNFVVSSCLPVL
jgi:hypothetical protein